MVIHHRGSALLMLILLAVAAAAPLNLRWVSPSREHVAMAAGASSSRGIIVVVGYNVSRETELRSKYGFVRLSSVPDPSSIPRGTVLVVLGHVDSGEELAKIGRLLLKSTPILFLDAETYIRVMDGVRSRIPGYYVASNPHTRYLVYVSSRMLGSKRAIEIRGTAAGNPDDVIEEAADHSYNILSSGDYGYSWIWRLSWSSGNDWYPYGRLEVEHKLGKVVNEDIGYEDWYVVRATTLVVPGKDLGWREGDHMYRADWVENKYELRYNGSYMYDLIEYDPGSQCDPSSISVSLGVAGIGFQASWSYSGNHIKCVDDNSGFYEDIAWWIHDLHDPGLLGWIASSERVYVEPGFVFAVSPLMDGMQRWSVKTRWAYPATPHGAPYGVERAVTFILMFNLY